MAERTPLPSPLPSPSSSLLLLLLLLLFASAPPLVAADASHVFIDLLGFSSSTCATGSVVWNKENFDCGFASPEFAQGCAMLPCETCAALPQACDYFQSPSSVLSYNCTIQPQSVLLVAVSYWLDVACTPSDAPTAGENRGARVPSTSLTLAARLCDNSSCLPRSSNAALFSALSAPANAQALRCGLMRTDDDDNDDNDIDNDSRRVGARVNVDDEQREHTHVATALAALHARRHRRRRV